MWGKNIDMTVIDELHKRYGDKPKKIYITTGGMRSGKSLLNAYLFDDFEFKPEYHIDAEGTLTFDGITVEQGIEKVKEIFDMPPKNEDKFTIKTTGVGMALHPIPNIWSHVSLEPVNKFEIRDVIVNYPATIVLWEDDTKTVVKCENEDFDLEKAIAMAFARKALGNKYGYYNVFKKWLKKAKDFSKQDK